MTYNIHTSLYSIHQVVHMILMLTKQTFSFLIKLIAIQNSRKLNTHKTYTLRGQPL